MGADEAATKGENLAALVGRSNPQAMKQTAVEWLYNNLKSHFEHDGDLLECVQMSMQQAKEIEKEQMLNAFEESRLTHPMIGFKHETFKEYYKKTFKTNEK
jgi:hypothetical protein